jgi:ribosomal protein S18 acetylase RimI-like enzyme
MNQAPTRIIHAGAGDAARIGSILGDAFTNDPVINWAIPAPSLYPRFFAIMAERLFLAHRQVYLDDRDRGAAMWLPPNVNFDIPATPGQVMLLIRLLLSRGPAVIKRLLQLQKTMTAHHPHEPHYYLQSIGARQDCQGQGVGSALLKQVTPLCDADQLPAYLESSNAANVALYERHGFEVVNEERIGDDGPPMWFMLRPPR